jgi:hypothetical protein
MLCIKAFLILALLGLSSGARAATYNVNLFDPNPIGVTTIATAGGGCLPVIGCIPFYETPIFVIRPGDVVNFGQITLPSQIYTSDSRYYPNTTVAWFGTFAESFNPPISPYQFFEGSCTYITGDTPCFLPTYTTTTYDLNNFGPGEVQFAFVVGNPDSPDYVYVPPTVPEPSTWAMLLIGFAAIGFAGYRRRSQATMATGNG